MYQQDWIMRQIEQIMQIILHVESERSQILAEIIENQIDEVTNSYGMEPEPELYYEILSLLNVGEINRAETLLFEAARHDAEKIYLNAAMEFYANLSKMGDDFLEKNNYSRAEIGQGLLDILDIYRIKYNK